MVMGRTHSLHGFTAGIAASQLTGIAAQLDGVPVAFVLGMLGAGAAIAADLDHPNATASTSLGPISWAASAGIRAISRRVYAATKTRSDRPNADGHRGITHTWPGALALGTFFGGGCALAELFGGPPAGRVATVVVLWLFLVWALRGLPPRNRHSQDYALATILTGIAWTLLSRAYPTGLPVLIGATIALGLYVHALGDGLTYYGSPLVFPFIVKGQRWYSCGMPQWLRFRAGKGWEKGLVFPLSLLGAAAALIWLFPGAWPGIVHAVSLAL
jgi:hypothetical protein